MSGWDWQWGEHGGRKANWPGWGGSNGGDDGLIKSFLICKSLYDSLTFRLYISCGGWMKSMLEYNLTDRPIPLPCMPHPFFLPPHQHLLQ